MNDEVYIKWHYATNSAKLTKFFSSWQIDKLRKAF